MSFDRRHLGRRHRPRTARSRGSSWRRSTARPRARSGRRCWSGPTGRRAPSAAARWNSRRRRGRGRRWREARDRLDRLPLGPALGQCCGGAVTLLTEVWDAARLATATGEVVARPLPGGRRRTMPLAVARLADGGAGQGRGAVVPGLVAGLDGRAVRQRPRRALWIWGAGHVGRALVDVLAPLPDLAITWVDTGPERFPDDDSAEASRSWSPPTRPMSCAMRRADAEHLILTYSHALDLELCHRLLAARLRAAAGLIGSATKWARFRSRLAAAGACARRGLPASPARSATRPSASIRRPLPWASPPATEDATAQERPQRTPTG